MYTPTYNNDDLLKRIRQIINEELEKFKENIEQAKKLPENLVNIKRVMTELGISKATVYNWKAKGLIKPVKAGGKTLFNLSDIMKSIKDNGFSFGRDREYLYKLPAEKRDKEKLDRKYHNISWKLMEGKSVSPEEMQFYQHGKPIMEQTGGSIKQERTIDNDPEDIDNDDQNPDWVDQ